jgi:hypothetical protein
VDGAAPASGHPASDSVQASPVDAGHGAASPSPDPAVPSPAGTLAPAAPAGAEAEADVDVPDLLPAPTDVDADAPAGDAPEEGASPEDGDGADAREKRSLLSRIIGAWKRFPAAPRGGGAETDLHQEYGR